MSKVCIDAGHYGSRYNHSPVVAEYYESDRMWVLAELLIAALKKRGVTVVKTRTNKDSDFALTARGKKAQGCDLFLSLHSNAASAESVDYPVAYVFRADAKTDLDERSQEIGLKLAKVVQQLMGTKQPARTATRGSSNDRDGNGLLDDEYYGVLHGAKTVKVPGVILEHSFHTNTVAAKWLMSDANLSKLAEAEADCIAAWLKNTLTTPTADASLPYRVRVSINDLNIRSGPSTNYVSKGYIKPGVYTIVATDGIWLKLKSGAGWISSKYATKI